MTRRPSFIFNNKLPIENEMWQKLRILIGEICLVHSYLRDRYKQDISYSEIILIPPPPVCVLAGDLPI